MGIEIHTKQNDTWSVATIYDGDLTSVAVIHEPSGTKARGHAKRNPEDTYDRALGFNLAYFRALERVSNKVVKLLESA